MGWWNKKVRDLTGITAQQEALAAEQKRIEDESNALLKKKDPKALATKRKEPWVNVLDMQVNGDNIRNGFFELDWNKYFIEELIENGYGTEADKEEEIVGGDFVCSLGGRVEIIDLLQGHATTKILNFVHSQKKGNHDI